MRLNRTVTALLLLSLTVIAAQRAASQEKDQSSKNATQPDMREMMKKWNEVASPGEHHAVLDNFVGKWETTSRMWFEGPGKPAVETKGSSEIKWVLDGRFIAEEATGEVMGKPFKGLGLRGYDNIKKKYVASWVDNMGTALATSEGDYEPGGRVLMSLGKIDEPLTGERDKTIKYVYRILSRDRHVLEMYDLVGSPNEFKAVEITYTRKR